MVSVVVRLFFWVKLPPAHLSPHPFPPFFVNKKSPRTPPHDVRRFVLLFVLRVWSISICPVSKSDSLYRKLSLWKLRCYQHLCTHCQGADNSCLLLGTKGKQTLATMFLFHVSQEFWGETSLQMNGIVNVLSAV